MNRFGLLIAALLGVGCGATVPAPTLYDDGNQNAPSCPIPATYSGQDGLTGDPCTNAALDCQPACCECPSGGDSFWASECYDGACLDPTTACNDAPSASFCN